MKWSILVLTQPSRTEFLRRLMGSLAPQVAKFSGVEVVIAQFDKKFSIGKNRGMMIEAAAGEYVNFVDDDDLVAEDYVSSIYPLLDGVDYVGFLAKFHRDGVYCGKLSFHSLDFKGWSENAYGYFRDISHLNPIKKELAILGKMGDHDGRVREDFFWASRLRSLGSVKTEHFVPRPMYLVYYRSDKPDGWEVTVDAQREKEQHEKEIAEREENKLRQRGGKLSEGSLSHDQCTLSSSVCSGTARDLDFQSPPGVGI